MDGNRRWAQTMGLPHSAGHAAGYRKLKKVIKWAKEAGIKHLIVYAFSKENWNRSQAEIDILLNLLRRVMKEAENWAKKDKIRIKFIGIKKDFPKDIKEAMYNLEKMTASNKNFTLGIAASYGGRAEIISAVRRIDEKKLKKITEKQFEKYLWTHSFPDPDLVIRTSGEMRLSGFLPWQSVYSELYFSKTLWPAFSKREFLRILEEYSGRDRRIGK